ncbi:unnamed protein product [Moneuplotes crassus]|uniref:Uncharacterized protein n=1 Tax=Euplotes crassus TaxID=5936 RepID=A0AAD1U3G0_EUPCR|nr:unnamed protein product [Moneuplotes crassus]
MKLLDGILKYAKTEDAKSAQKKRSKVLSTSRVNTKTGAVVTTLSPGPESCIKTYIKSNTGRNYQQNLNTICRMQRKGNDTRSYIKLIRNKRLYDEHNPSMPSKRERYKRNLRRSKTLNPDAAKVKRDRICSVGMHDYGPSARNVLIDPKALVKKISEFKIIPYNSKKFIKKVVSECKKSHEERLKRINRTMSTLNQRKNSIERNYNNFLLSKPTEKSQIQNLSNFIKVKKAFLKNYLKMPLKRLNLDTFEFSNEISEGWGPPPLELFEKSIERLRNENNTSVEEIQKSIKAVKLQNKSYFRKPISLENLYKLQKKEDEELEGNSSKKSKSRKVKGGKAKSIVKVKEKSEKKNLKEDYRPQMHEKAISQIIDKKTKLVNSKSRPVLNPMFSKSNNFSQKHVKHNQSSNQIENKIPRNDLLRLKKAALAAQGAKLFMPQNPSSPQ